MVTHVTGLDAKVLVLNRLYTAVRVIDARRAFTMLCRRAAEIIAIDDGKYLNYDLDSWTEIAEFQHQFEFDKHDWVRTSRFTASRGATSPAAASARCTGARSTAAAKPTWARAASVELTQFTHIAVTVPPRRMGDSAT